eukprot:914134-Pyramimonas_sp.AAC.1
MMIGGMDNARKTELTAASAELDSQDVAPRDLRQRTAALEATARGSNDNAITAAMDARRHGRG